MKIITYNVNGIRAAINKGFLEWLAASDADVVCLQEIKAMVEQIPTFEFEALGYHTYWYSAQKKGYSGVAILSKSIPDHVVYGMGIDEYDFEGRMIRADFGKLSVISVYHPSGTTGEARQSFKMKWLEDFQKYILKLQVSQPYLVVSGDYNICHQAIDIHDPIRNATSSGFLPEERDWMTGFLATGFVDSFRHHNKMPHQYTWWSYRAGARSRNLGWRIDYNMVSPSLKNHIKRVAILPQAMHSDHCPTLLEIELIDHK